MTEKLFTRLNVGAFELRHRVVVAWEVEADKGFGDQHRIATVSRVPLLEGGLVILDPSCFAWRRTGAVTAGEAAAQSEDWRRLIEVVKSARHTVVARLSASLARLAPDGVGADIAQIVEAYAEAARRAKSVGFDGIELDGSFGSPIDLIFRGAARLSAGWSAAKVTRRIDFLMALIEGLSHAYGRERIGVRLSPFVTRGARRDDAAVYVRTVGWLHDHELAYVHLTDAGSPTSPFVSAPPRLSPAAQALRNAYPGILISNSPQSLPLSIELVASRWADAVCFSGARLDAQFLDELRRAWRAP